MKVYKLQYQDKSEAQADLLAKGVYIETQNLDKEIVLAYGQGIQAIVEIGLIVDKPATFDNEGNVLTEPIYFNGYHYDIMSENSIIFENEIEVNNPKHTFAGYES
jgi:uncharacterized protein (UPF0333 family)